MLLELEWYARQLERHIYDWNVEPSMQTKISMGQVLSVGFAYLSDLQWFCGLFCSFKHAFH
jgi:hypothetical protein